MARELTVRIVGDASSLEKTFRRSAAGAKRFDREMSQTFRGTIAGSGAFRGLGRSVAFASAGFLGAAGLTSAVRSAFSEMSNAQKVAAQTSAALKSTGGVAGVTAKHVDELAASLLNLSGVDDEAIKGAENLLLTFTNIRNVVGKGNDVFDQATRAALDMSVALGQELPQSAIQLGKALNDPVKGITALQRVGVTFTKSQRDQIKALVESGHVLEAQKVILRELTREFGGSAKAAGDTFAGKLGKLRQNVLNMEGAIATLLLPTVTKLTDQLVTWTQNTDNQKRVLDDAKQAIGAVTDVANVLKGAFDGLNTITGSTKHSLELLFGVLVTYKTLKIASNLTKIADGFGLINTNARNARKAAERFGAPLPGTAGGPAGPPATPGESTAAKLARNIGKTGAVLAVAFAGAKGLQKLIGQAPLLISPQSMRLGVRSPAVPDIFQPTRPGAVRPPAGILGPATAAGGAGARRPGVTPAPTPVDPKFLRAAREAARQQVVDLAAFAVEKTALTKGIADDIAANQKLNALLKRRIAGGHDTIEMQRQQLQVQLTLNDLLAQQAAARKAAAQAAKQAASAARSAKQFRLLGFGPTGEDLVPGRAALKRQADAVQNAISGTFLDTGKNETLIKNIEKILNAPAKIADNVRAKMTELLADLKAKLNQSSVDVTRFSKAASGQFVLAGAHPQGGMTIHVQNMNLHGIHNMKELENELLKRNKQRAHNRRSNR